MNLSGKKTRAGRISGECCTSIDSHQRGKPIHVTCVNDRCNFQVQGQGIPIKGIRLSFFMLLWKFVTIKLMKEDDYEQFKTYTIVR